MLWSIRGSPPAGRSVHERVSIAPVEVTLSRKGAKKQTHGRKLRSTGTKARTRVGAYEQTTGGVGKEARSSCTRRRLTEALEQQTATSEVLRHHLQLAGRTGASVPGYVGERDTHLRGQVRHAVSVRGRCASASSPRTTHRPPMSRRAARSDCHRPPPDMPLARVAAHKGDSPASPTSRTTPPYNERDPFVMAAVELAGYRTVLAVPMLKEGELIGAITHPSPRGTPVHRQADRACRELRRPGRHRHREHAAAQRAASAYRRSDRALQQQTATAEVLKVISPARPASWSPCSRRCWPTRHGSARPSSAFYSSTKAKPSAQLRCYGASPASSSRRNGTQPCRPIMPGSRSGASCSDQADGSNRRRRWPIRHITQQGQVIGGETGARTMLGVPMLKEGELIGTIIIFARRSVRSPRSRSSWSRTSPPRQSSPSRTPACSTSWRARRIRCSSRPPPLTCSR